jgi:hypothetical protein
VGAVGGATLGAVLGDAVLDLGAMGLQNYITQGTILPRSQVLACGRLFGVVPREEESSP